MRIIHQGSVIENIEPPNCVPTKFAVHGRRRNSITHRDQSSAISTVRMPAAAYGGHARINRRMAAGEESRSDHVGMFGIPPVRSIVVQ